MHASYRYVKKRMQSLEHEKCSFTLFVISDIKEAVEKELTSKSGTNNTAPMKKLCRELRDFYFVYLDALHHMLRVVRDHKASESVRL